MQQSKAASDSEYWREFYAAGGAPSFPSQFAIFVQSWLVGRRATIREFGCGNGRDARFFHDLGHFVEATDQVVGPELVDLASTSERFRVREGDIETTSALPGDPGEAELLVLYSRFFQHAITEDAEVAMLANLAEANPPGTLAFFEFRLEEDAELPKTFGGHYRRYAPADGFVDRLTAAGFDVQYRNEGKGFARFGTEDPFVGRFVAELR